MKKKIIGSIILCIVILSAVIIVRNRQKTVRLLENVDIETISNIIIYQPATYITITEHNDIKKIVDLLQSMKLKKSRPSEKAGAFPVFINFHNGDSIDYVFLSEEVTTDEGCYKPDRDYCDDIRSLYDELSKKYPEEPNKSEGVHD